MMRRNPTFSHLKGSYLFPEIEKRKEEFLKKFPEVELLNFGIGDTTLPLPKGVADAMAKTATEMGTSMGYRGYCPEVGLLELRQRISEVIYQQEIGYEEIFISDGAGSDIGRLQSLIGPGRRVAVQDPSYPAYVDASVICGAQSIVYLPCLPENDFFPDLTPATECDVLYFCSPNNPTGTASTAEQLRSLVEFAHRYGVLIIFDAAYAQFVRDPHIPSSIYQIPGAREVAIEVNSFSKLAGFTGVRLGWSVIPKELRYFEGEVILADWERLVCTFFNGASRISQAGGMAVLTCDGMAAIENATSSYLENASLIRGGMESMGAKVFGGENAPYVWAQFEGRSSWDLFEELLYEHQMLTIPGRGFGPSGEGFVRLSSFCTREQAPAFGRRSLVKS